MDTTTCLLKRHAILKCDILWAATGGSSCGASLGILTRCPPPLSCPWVQGPPETQLPGKEDLFPALRDQLQLSPPPKEETQRLTPGPTGVEKKMKQTTHLAIETCRTLVSGGSVPGHRLLGSWPRPSWVLARAQKSPE